MTSFLLCLLVFWEFFKIGLFSVGGGPATLPYLMELSSKYNWFTMEELTNMIAISESTPGPLGVNMATYVGVQTLGVFGGVVATLGLVTPSIIIICIIAAFFNKLNNNQIVKSAFSAIRPAVCSIIAVSVLGICKVSLFTLFDYKSFSFEPLWYTIILSGITLIMLQIKQLKKIHPFFYFVFGAIIGIIFKL